MPDKSRKYLTYLRGGIIESASSDFCPPGVGVWPRRLRCCSSRGLPRRRNASTLVFSINGLAWRTISVHHCEDMARSREWSN